MSVVRYPVCVFEDPAGRYGGVLLDDDQFYEASGASPEEVLRLLRELLAWLDQEQGGLYDPALGDVTLTTLRVAVRPEYRLARGVLPCDEPLGLDVPCVTARRGPDLRVAFLPLLRRRFAYYPEQDLAELVAHTVRQALRGSTPQQLTRHLPPRRVLLRDVAVRTREEARRRPTPPEVTSLRGVAEALSDNAFAKRFMTPWGREREVADLVERLRTERQSVLILGEAGSGKTAVLVDAARRLARAERDAKRGAAPPRFWVTRGGRLIAGMRYLGEWEQQLEEVVRNVTRLGGVLCLESLLETIQAGGRGPRDSVAAFLAPYIEHGELRVVAECTKSELAACRRLFPGLIELFQILELPPLERPAQLAILGRIAATRGASAGVTCERGALETIQRLFARFLPYQAFPGPAARFLRERIEEAERAGTSELTVAAVLARFVAQTGLPERFVRDDLVLTAEGLTDELTAQVIGQPEAVGAAVDLALTFKAGLNDRQRPLGVLLFCGPTGVGKTALAGALARLLFGAGQARDRLVRLDMSEYGGFGAAARLLGTPSEPSDLIRRLRQQPFCVVLLDEIEKAAPDVFDLLLGVLDEGRLTDPLGRETSFNSAVIVMTSNLGAGSERSLGFADAAAGQHEHEVRRFFRPEFFNRLDRVVTFGPLARASIERIVRKELAEVARREGLERRGLELTWSDALEAVLIERGFDPRYGARPLQRTVETLVVTALARLLVERPELAGLTLHLDWDAARGCVEISGPGRES